MNDVPLLINIIRDCFIAASVIIVLDFFLNLSGQELALRVLQYCLLDPENLQQVGSLRPPGQILLRIAMVIVLGICTALVFALWICTALFLLPAVLKILGIP